MLIIEVLRYEFIYIHNYMYIHLTITFSSFTNDHNYSRYSFREETSYYKWVCLFVLKVMRILRFWGGAVQCTSQILNSHITVLPGYLQGRRERERAPGDNLCAGPLRQGSRQPSISGMDTRAWRAKMGVWVKLLGPHPLDWWKIPLLARAYNYILIFLNLYPRLT